MTKPISQHEIDPSTSIDVNIIGTANITRLCIQYKIKLIYISTDYVYPGTQGNYSENDPVLPSNNYAWSKLGGECCVHMYKNSLILRIAMCNHPWKHKNAIIDDVKNWIYDKDLGDIIIKLKDEYGIINIGGPPLSSYNFARIDNPNVGQISLNDIKDVQMCKNTSMDLSKLKSKLLAKEAVIRNANI